MTLDVVIEKGKIEDLLKLAIKTDPPVMTGVVRMKTKFDLPPGEPDVADRLKLAGNFQVSGTHFTNEKIQGKVDSLSMRSQGKPSLAQDNIPDNVHSDLKGTFSLAEWIAGVFAVAVRGSGNPGEFNWHLQLGWEYL